MTDIELLKYIQRTNPEMTMERMIEELSKCRYSAVADMLHKSQTEVFAVLHKFWRSTDV